MVSSRGLASKFIKLRFHSLLIVFGKFCVGIRDCIDGVKVDLAWNVSAFPLQISHSRTCITALVELKFAPIRLSRKQCARFWKTAPQTNRDDRLESRSDKFQKYRRQTP
jgi:hypothetical protein